MYLPALERLDVGREIIDTHISIGTGSHAFDGSHVSTSFYKRLVRRNRSDGNEKYLPSIFVGCPEICRISASEPPT